MNCPNYIHLLDINDTKEAITKALEKIRPDVTEPGQMKIDLLMNWSDYEPTAVSVAENGGWKTDGSFDPNNEKLRKIRVDYIWKKTGQNLFTLINKQK